MKRPALKRDVRRNVQPSEVDVAPIGQPFVDVPETQVVRTRRVACDGGEGALGHQRVWMTIPAQGFVDCGYCDKRFVLADDADKGWGEAVGAYTKTDPAIAAGAAGSDAPAGAPPLPEPE